ncbi:MAG: rhodanese-like domain-containing protein [Chloroflexi bacterium]|nr:rhodanese-like domain-containing protein [Chloroflexota bacterium]
MELEKTPEVSTEELRQVLAARGATVFDARPFKEFAISHIPGALNVAPKPGQPMSQYVSDVAEIERIVKDKAAPLVLYCNGPYCGKSKRLAEELLGAGFTKVSRYQLGIPTWRALVGLTQIEKEGVRYVLDGDKTAVVFDARDADKPSHDIGNTVRQLTLSGMGRGVQPPRAGRRHRRGEPAGGLVLRAHRPGGSPNPGRAGRARRPVARSDAVDQCGRDRPEVAGAPAGVTRAEFPAAAGGASAPGVPALACAPSGGAGTARQMSC